MIYRTELNPTQTQYQVSSPPPQQQMNGRTIQLLTFTVTTVKDRSIISATYYDVIKDEYGAAGTTVDELDDLELFDKELLTWCYEYHQTAEATAVSVLPPRVTYSHTGRRWVWHCQQCTVSGIALHQHVGKRLAKEHAETVHGVTE